MVFRGVVLLSEMVILIALVLSGLEDTNSGASAGSWCCRALVQLVVLHWWCDIPNWGRVVVVLHWAY